VGRSRGEALSLPGEKTHGIPRGGDPRGGRGDGVSGAGGLGRARGRRALGYRIRPGKGEIVCGAHERGCEPHTGVPAGTRPAACPHSRPAGPPARQSEVEAGDKHRRYRAARRTAKANLARWPCRHAGRRPSLPWRFPPYQRLGPKLAADGDRLARRVLRRPRGRCLPLLSFIKTPCRGHRRALSRCILQYHRYAAREHIGMAALRRGGQARGGRSR